MSGELKTKVGGQAVLEGVMMRSPKCFAVVVRRKDGALVVREQPWVGEWALKLAKIPFLRGMATLVESMSNGYNALNFSAEQMEEDLVAEEEAEAKEKSAASGESPTTAAKSASNNSAGGGMSSEIANKIAMLFAIGFFIALPQLLAWAASKVVGIQPNPTSMGFLLVTGFFKLALVLGYMTAIRRIPEVKRVFQYHGAEHKAIATFEAGEPLEVEYAKKHSTRHARCGTTFLIVVVIVSVLVWAVALPPLVRLIGWGEGHLTSLGLKLLLLPFIAGLSYELQRLSARFSDSAIARLFLGPGYMVQGITTIEPSDDQLEVALASLKVTLAREAAESAGKSAPVTEPVVRKFRSFAQFSEQFAIAGFKGQ